MRANRSLLRRASFVAGAGLLAVVSGQQFGCSSGSDTSGSSPEQGGADGFGTVGMNLTLPGGETLNAVSWVITGPNGASTVVQQGSTNIQNSQTIGFTVGGIPAGSGYSVSISGTTVDGTVTCAGSTSFSVTSRQTTSVTVLMQCGSPAPDAGSAAIGAQTYNCAVASGVSASPSETTVGSAVNLTATATGPNAGALAYAWSAPSGTFSAPTGASTSFTCTASGPVVATVSVSDGTLPSGASCNPALATSTVTVQCDSALDAGAQDATTTSDASGPTACSLGAGGAVKHVIYVQFDNTHLSQDFPNVQSDLEQMPHLLNFIRGNGTMMANDHTILISHTGGGILSTLTGVYPDRHGQTVSNSYVRTSSAGAFSFPSTFQYWTDSVSASGTPTVPNLVQPDGTNMPAPWASYTRAGCNFGAVGIADMELENVSTGATGDVTTVFGANSPQWNEAKANSTKAAADFEGIAVHCAKGSAVCATGETDALPQEPGGYTGFQALFGAQQIDPLLTGQDAGVALIDLLGNPIQDSSGNPGFPGFNGMEAAVALGYMAAMQEHGVPVTYAYISDAHDNHNNGGANAAYGPGQQGYTQQLQAYDQAFANFFTRLASDGINQSNTLFVFTVDEGDHFVGVAPSPSTCDGTAGNFCSYPPPAGQSSGIGEVNVNVDTLFTSEQSAVASQFKMGNSANPSAPNDFTVHGDDAPTFYLSRISASAGTTGPLAETDPVTRSFERAAGQLTLVNPYTGNTDNLLFKMADQAGMQALHMVAAGDPARNPTFTYFADDDYFITDFPTSTCADCIVSSFAWNHGDDQSVIGQTWLGIVGPGVKNLPDQTVYTDHTDVRPTMNSILGLHDDYISDGRVITQALQSTDYSSNLSSNVTTVETLGDNYKQINSPFDVFAQCILTASTYALQADDATYASFESSITNLTSQRDTLATSIKTALDGAEFGTTPITSSQATTWINQAQTLVASCNSLVATIPPATDAGAPPSDAGSTSTPDTGTDAGASSDAGASNSDVVVYRVGDGVAGLLSSGAAVFVDEFNSTTGALVKSTAMPTVASGGNHRLIASGVASSEGLITTSVDGRYVVLTGYDAPIPFTTADGGTGSVASSTSAQAARVVGRLDAAGEVDTSTALTDFSSGNNPRGVASTDGTNLWVAGAVDSIHFTTLGSTTSVQLSTALTNLRAAEIFGSQLFVSDSSGSAVRLGTVGTGLPTTAGQTITNLPGFLTSGSPYAFFFADLDGTPGLDTLYVADDGSSGSSGGLTKYGLVSGSWAAKGTVGSAADTYRGVTGVVSGTTVTLYAVRKGGTAAAGGGELDALVDSTGFGGTFAATPSVLATATANTSFRGVALAPHP
jgi:hypothetical protein